jgi:hypothetical protein
MAKQKFNPLLDKRFQEVSTSSGGGLIPFVQEQTVSNTAKVTLSGSKPITNDTVVSFVTRITAVKLSTGDSYCAILKGGGKKVSGVSSSIDTDTLEIYANNVAAAGWEVTSNTTATTIDLSVNSNGDASAIKWRLETIFNEVLI